MFFVAFFVAGWIAITIEEVKQPRLFGFLTVGGLFLACLTIPSTAFGSWMGIVGAATGYLVMSALKEAQDRADAE